MTRAEIARKLLAHGPLTLREFVEITGWKYHACVCVLAGLRGARLVRLARRGGGQPGVCVSSQYEVADDGARA